MIVVIVLVDVLGFSIVMPLLGPFAEHYGFEEWRIGLLFAAYPVCQLVTGPILGRLSDRYGRRPLLVYSQAGTAVSFVILGLSHDFWVMLLARMLDGASGGNFLVAQAYVADVTPPEGRSRGLGLMGMAFGMGFVLGPLLGGAILSLPIAYDLRLRLPFLVAAGFSTAAWILVLARLPESRDRATAPREHARVLSWRGLVDTAGLPGVGRLITIGFLGILAFAAFEGTFALFLNRRMGWNERTAAFAFSGMGVASAVVQGGLIRRLVPRFGEHRLILAGLSLAAIGFAGLAATSYTPLLITSMGLLAIGQGLIGPSVGGLLSRTTPRDEQGAVFGVYSSAQTLARLISYAIANVMLGKIGAGAPYWTSSAVDLTALAVSVPAAMRAVTALADPQAPRTEPVSRAS